MRVLVLDTIHGGTEIAAALRLRNDTADAVDVYRGTGFSAEAAAARTYDLVTAPVHLDPAYPLLAKAPVVTHHEMVRTLVTPPRLSIEITGARGKTTTASAVAHLCTGRGILHTSSGTYQYPEKTVLGKKSITIASVISAAKAAQACGAEWLVAEESVGVAGFGTLGILTSPDDYLIAAGKKSALAAKCDSLRRCETVLVPRGVPVQRGWQVIEDLVSVSGDTLIWDGGELRNPLLTSAGYRAALSAAAAAGVLLNLEVGRLSTFQALPGRMHLAPENGVPILDNANSGTNADTTIEAAAYLRRMHPLLPVTLVIGIEHHAVCEGFAADEIRRAVTEISPAHLILVCGDGDVQMPNADNICATLADAELSASALAKKTGGSILLAVKTWR